jgi:hopanoid biosynthesis associated protein HpnK
MHGPGLIITADDFGLHPSVNRAVELAHRDGVLTAASMMVGAPAMADAVARARACSRLRVGLHLVLADGRPVLSPHTIPDLVDENGCFRAQTGATMAREGMRFFCLPRVRRQLADEIRAQFDAFAATGLALDHVNAHKHFHLHPTVLGLIVDIGRGFGLHAVRLPREAGLPLWLRPWLALQRALLAAAGIAHNDYLVGMRGAGRFDTAAMLQSLHGLPRSGIGELYVHPALESGAAIAPTMHGYRHADQFAALVSPRVAWACGCLRAQGFRFGGFGDLTAPGPPAAPRASLTPRSQ